MRIDRTARIAPPAYEWKLLGKYMGNRIAEADHSDVLAAFLWVTEGRIVAELWADINAHCEAVKRERDDAGRRDDVIYRRDRVILDSPTAHGCARAAASLQTALDEQLEQAQDLRTKAYDLWHETTNDYGDLRKVRARYSPGVPRPISPIDETPQVRAQLNSARRELRQALARDIEEMHRLALIEDEHLRFTATELSISIEALNTMTPVRFELAIAELCQRDGFTLTRAMGGSGDLGADVIAVTPAGCTIVIQCKHVRSLRTSVGSPVVQRLNGTARPVHGADIAVVVTNGKFSMPAYKFARSQNIHLIGSRGLTRWAEWGEPLLAILDIDDTQPARPQPA